MKRRININELNEGDIVEFKASGNHGVSKSVIKKVDGSLRGLMIMSDGKILTKDNPFYLMCRGLNYPNIKKIGKVDFEGEKNQEIDNIAIKINDIYNKYKI